MSEIWKDIPHYEGLYQVSNYGRVKSLERFQQNHSKLQRVPERIKAQVLKPNGYQAVNLYKNGRGKMEYVHRLVAMAFLDNPERKPQVDHIDGDRANNILENLRWVNQSENNLNPVTRNKRLGVVINGTKVRKFDLDGNLITEYKSVRQAERENGFSNGLLSKWFGSGDSCRYKGFIWKK